VKQAPWLLAPVGELVVDGCLRLDPAETRHATGALRLVAGQEVVLTDGAGVVASGTLAVPRRGVAEVAIHSLTRTPRPASGLTVAIGLLAGAAMDMVVQKAVELGVLRLVPVCCRRSQLGARRAATRTDHWTRLARQSLKQCRREWEMEIAEPTPLTELLDGIGPDRGVVADPNGVGVAKIGHVADPVLLVGPEGGFDPAEKAALDEAGWPRLRLSRLTLRAETAAVAGAAVLLAAGVGKDGLHSTDV
jgi:16S rRNA (uracil1498-N3)-methyltransferase